MTSLRLARWTTLVCLVSVPLLTATPTARAAEKWSSVRTTAPETVEELKALQDAVKRVIDKCTPCTVGLLVEGDLNPRTGRKDKSAGSGVIVSADGLILTVGHVIDKPSRTCEVILPDGTVVAGKTLGTNKELDTGMAQITDEGPNNGKWPYLKTAKSGKLQKGQWVVTLGHPGGPQDGRAPVVRLGQVIEVDLDSHVVRTSCKLVGGDSGGPLFDLDGNVVGIHDRIGFTLESNVHLPIESFEGQWDRLVKGEAIKKAAPAGRGASLGVIFGDKQGGGIKLEEVVDDGPAQKGGLTAGDIIIEFDGVKVASADDVREILRKKRPGEDVEVVVKRGAKTVQLTVTLGKTS